MDRTEFLQMCQRVSILENGICGIKKDVPDELKVVDNGILYYPVAYELGFEKGKPVHLAILHDLKTNSKTYVYLERVVKYEQVGSVKNN